MTDIECPTCGKTGFSTEGYMKRHHKLVHGKSLRKKHRCSATGCDKKTSNPKFCSQECLGKDRRKYEKTVCARPQCDEEVYKRTYCSTTCANKESWKKRDNPAKRQEVREKIARSQIGDKNNMRKMGGHSEETKKKLSAAASGENNPMYGKTGEDHPKYGIVSGLKRQVVEECGHAVRSNWEKEIALMLHREGIDYEYEPKTFDLSSGITYTPDFIVDRAVIEVKGWSDNRSKKRARGFMQQFPGYTYIVVGNKVPCDIFIEWENRNRVLDVLQERE